jgi:hypothetical protein
MKPDVYHLNDNERCPRSAGLLCLPLEPGESLTQPYHICEFASVSSYR